MIVLPVVAVPVVAVVVRPLVPAAATAVVPVPLVVDVVGPVDAVVPLPDVVPLVAVVAAPAFAVPETSAVADRVVGAFFDKVDAVIVTPVDDDPLPGDGKPVFAAERETGALVGNDGWLRTAFTMTLLNCSVVVS